MFKNPLFKFLSSLRLAIFLLLILAATSVIGTILPQGEPLGFYWQRYGPFMVRLIKFFQLNNAYHSWWYVTLLVLFSLNLLFCSLKRLPYSIALYRRDPLELDLKRLKRLANARETFLSGEPKTCFQVVKEKAEQVLGSLQEVTFENGMLLVKDRFRWSYFAVYVVHLAILLVLLGGIVGAIWGVRGSIMLLEGESTNKVALQNARRSFISLPFQVRCDRFRIDFYPNNMPKEYRSDLTFTDGDKKIQGTVRVNHPLSYRGFTFYQSSYQTLAEVHLKLQLQGKEKTVVLKPFAQAVWSEAHLRLGLMEIGQAHGFMAAHLWISYKDQAPQSVWVMLGRPWAVPLGEKATLMITLEDLRPIYATGLEVKKDPGVILVWIGFLTLIIGIFVAFFFAHQRYWIAILPQKKGVQVILAGMSPKNREGVRRKIEELQRVLVAS